MRTILPTIIALHIAMINLISAPLAIRNITNTNAQLYQTQTAFESGYLRVSSLHEIYYEQYGNPNGIPVVYLHGGPGAGCHHSETKFFDPNKFRLVMYDQRGAMRSRPFGCMQENTPQLNVEDLETLRTRLKIDTWFVVGGSYGSLLALLYGETYPQSVRGFVLRGMFTGEREQYEHLFFGMHKFYPKAYADMCALVPESTRESLIAACDKQLMHSDPVVHMPMARAFFYYDALCAGLGRDPDHFAQSKDNDQIALSISRAFVHFATHDFYLQENQIMRDLAKITHLPAILINGRYDLICPPENAFIVHKQWPNSQLWYLTNAGHVSSEPAISEAIKLAIEQLTTGNVQ